MGLMKYITFNKISIQFKMIYINLGELNMFAWVNLTQINP